MRPYFFVSLASYVTHLLIWLSSRFPIFWQKWVICTSNCNKRLPNKMVQIPLPKPAAELSDAQWKIVSSILLQYLPGVEVWAFGSRVTGRAKTYSDLDLVVVQSDPMPLPISAAIREAFSESDLPWKVDLIDWATTSPSFREIIGRNCVVIQPQSQPKASQ